MNLRSNVSLLIICAMVIVGMNYHTLLNLKTIDTTGDETPFSPPQSKPHIHMESSPNDSTVNDSGSSTPTATKLDIESLLNFTIPEPQTSGRQAPQRRNGTEYKSPFKHLNNGNHWWTYTDSCFAVDDVCRHSHNRWFYIDNSSANESAKWQPTFELKYMPQAYQNRAYADTRVQMTVDASHKISWRELERSSQCVISNDPYHIVLQSLYNDMIGEFYSRSLMYVHKLLSIAPVIQQAFEQLNALNMSNSDMGLFDDNQPPIEQTQYYVHITIANKGLLDAHKLLLSGMHRLNDTQSTRWAKSAVDLLLPENESCQCYQKLVFCGYDTYMQQHRNASERYTLWPSKYIDKSGDDIEGDSACNPVSPLFTMLPNECQEFAKLKSHLLSNIEANFPSIEDAIAQHRRALLLRQNLVEENYNGDTKEWSIVGLAQRYLRRKWLNLANITEACNGIFNNQNVLCVEVNVEGANTPYEQFIIHRSLDALVGVHGAQLTQAVFLPAGSHVLELLPWIPEYIRGGWTARRTRPTPLGIIFHNTDINHYGYNLNRSSVPLCENAKPDDEKNCFTSIQNSQMFAWANRDFIVDFNVVMHFVEKFVLHQDDRCTDMMAETEFVLYNVWCKEEAHNASLHVRHFYRKTNTIS